MGSGKPETPCARMHLETASIACTACLDGGPLGGPPPGNSFWHCDWAALNAGENGLMPELELMLIPPPEPGSGKFGTPCDRMHWENARKSPELEAVFFGLLDDPQALMARAQAMATSETKMAMRLGIDWVVSGDR